MPKKTTRACLTLLIFAIVGADSFVSVARAEIQYPWCAIYRRGNGTNCGFSTLEQCLMTVRGIGGTCVRNPAYTPPTDRSGRSGN